MSMRHLGFLAAALAVSGSVGAAVVTQSATVLADTGIFGYSAHRLSNQSGLSLGYVSGVTSFADYAAANPTHSGSSGANGFLAVTGTSVDFDLGANFLVSQLGLWNDNDYQGVRQFSVQVAGNAAFAGASLVGQFMAQFGPVNYSQPIPLQLFDLADTTGRYIRVVFENNHGGFNGNPGNPYVNVGEVMFGVQAAPNAVPEPGSLALAGLALAAGVAASRRRG